MSEPGRKTVNARTTPFLEYDLEGPVQPEMSWLPLSFDRETQHGSDLMQAGKVTPVIDKRYRLSEAPEAFRYMERGHARGKVIIAPEY